MRSPTALISIAALSRDHARNTTARRPETPNCNMETLDGNSTRGHHASEKQLGDADRPRAVLRASAAAGNHVHLHGR